MTDQANKLREKVTSRAESSPRDRKTKVIAITSGKGGVGKSNVCLNLALSMEALDKKVMILDLDIGMANVDVLMGVTPKETLLSMLKKNLSLDEVLETGVNGLTYIAGGNGIGTVFSMTDDQLHHFFNEFSSLQGKVDYIILDTGAGLTPESMRFLQAADDIFIVLNPEPPSITDAYAVLKALHSKNANLPVKLIVNRTVSDQEGEQASANFLRASEQLLNKPIEVLGYIPDDDAVRKAVMEQTPFLLQYPRSKASLAINQIARTYLELPTQYKLGVKGFLMKTLFHK
ncbi:MinD/ParA family protein [Guptibacillus algicola]|uniref:MinD/ParA family protein n=1 Tax=Guptibacillus algicola TaxID=225844 RepID=UPI001CD225C4|nr:MinD/ParA family protein [Alkalihalobacillus algicola]MCA0988926.1 MinD/ParA family protein [Alkalihalobacillus algicola]